jgi:hypothetical protein
MYQSDRTALTLSSVTLALLLGATSGPGPDTRPRTDLR